MRLRILQVLLISVVPSCSDGPLVIKDSGPFSKGEIYLTVDRLLELYGYPSAMNGYTLTIVGRDTYLNGSLDYRGLTLIDCTPLGNYKRMKIRSGYFDANASYRDFNCFPYTEISHEVAHAVLVHIGEYHPCHWREYTLADLHPDSWFGPYGKVNIARDRTITDLCGGTPK